MKRVLITAFKPYAEWSTNASWLALVELTKELPATVEITTRLYPVEFAQVQELLAKDLADNYDVAIHLGQAPGRAAVEIEAFALNAGLRAGSRAEEFAPLLAGGPAAYTSPWPIAELAARIRAAGIPAGVSHHAGVYLCNAILYWSCHLVATDRQRTRSGFIHLPLDSSQVLDRPQPIPSLPAAHAAQAVRIVLEALCD